MNFNQIKFHYEEVDFELENYKRIAEVLYEFSLKENSLCEEINYIFCTDDFLLDLNRQYLRHDYYTDILSFQMDNDPIQGDIYISIDRVRDNAKSLNVDFNTEMLRVISHGILHFLGYKDKTEEEQKEMRAKEDELIVLLKE